MLAERMTSDNLLIRMDSRSLRMNRPAKLALGLENGGHISFYQNRETKDIAIKRDAGGIMFHDEVRETSILQDIALRGHIRLEAGSSYVIECALMDGMLVLDLDGVVRES